MAYDPRITLRNEQKYTILAKSNSKANIRLSDQLVHKLGTTRKSEILGIIGNTGEPYEKRLNDYLLGL